MRWPHVLTMPKVTRSQVAQRSTALTRSARSRGGPCMGGVRRKASVRASGRTHQYRSLADGFRPSLNVGSAVAGAGPLSFVGIALDLGAELNNEHSRGRGSMGSGR
jgi:hypothetical protein